MEDFGDEVFNAILKEGQEHFKAQAEAQKPTSQVKEESTGLDKQVLYLRIPTNVCVYIIQHHKIICPRKNILVDNPDFKLGTLASLPATLKVPDDIKDMSLTWVVKRVTGGWYKGQVANCARTINRLAAFENQIEFVPIKKDGKEYATLSKCRYGSVPYIPGASFIPWANNVFKLGEAGIAPRDIPSQLVTALAECKCVWTSAVASGFIARVKPVFNKIPNPNSMAWVIGPANQARVTKLASEVNPAAAYKLPDDVKGLFFGNSKAYSEFFDGFAYDEFGKVSVARMLVGLGHTKVYGQLNDMPTWSHQSCVLKVPNQVESITKHIFVDYRDTSKWPTDYLVYIATPVDLTLCVRTSTVNALAMPITAVLACAPQVGIFARRHEKVSVRIAMSDPPIAIFQKAEHGFLGLGIENQLKLLEKAIISGFLTVFLKRVNGESVFGFDLVPTETYSATKCHIKIQCFAEVPAFASQRYVSQTDSEKKKVLPTDRVSDVRVDGDLIFEQADASIMPMYPRCSPHTYANDPAFFKLKDSFEYGTNKRVETVDADIFAWTKGAAPEIIDGASGQVFVDAGNNAPKENPAPQGPAPAAAAPRPGGPAAPNPPEPNPIPEEVPIPQKPAEDVPMADPKPPVKKRVQKPPAPAVKKPTAAARGSPTYMAD